MTQRTFIGLVLLKEPAIQVLGEHPDSPQILSSIPADDVPNARGDVNEWPLLA